ncbi:MAG: ATP-binding protein [Leptolyngbya sp. SIO1D8]|nr:ATP-binding protein [Leptolyngbya sp. SIO1D8]
MTGLQGTNRSIRIEGSAHSSTIVSGDHNVIIQVFQQLVEQPVEALADREDIAAIGANPYMGLAAFKETDADRYFGREAQINKLWERFRDLYERSEIPRVLPILGPSGCGKSSLVRAGLLPELVQRPLPVRSSMRVAAMTPGAYPLESLASVLAEVNPTDPLLSDFEEELKQVGRDSNEYEGLRRIANRIRDIRDTPLIILIDQFEEVYSLCKQPEQERAFTQNLLHAASDPTGNVSVIFTLRTDFVGETQRYDQLNQIICAEGVLIPGMTKDELCRAIAEPARQAGHTFDDATVDLLVNDTEGREGALPLLQFALTQIWEGLRAGQAPIVTYRDIGGVGGALAGEAQKIYDKLTEPEKQTTQRIFIGLIQLGERTQDTRRRAIVENLVASQDTIESVRRVVQQFSSPSTRLISLSSQDGKETAEITHEALIQEWKLLQYWIKENQEKLIQRDKIELAAEEWKTQDKSNDYLWQGKLLENARSFRKLCGREFSLSELAEAFITQSLAREHPTFDKIVNCRADHSGKHSAEPTWH